MIVPLTVNVVEFSEITVTAQRTLNAQHKLSIFSALSAQFQSYSLERSTQCPDSLTGASRSQARSMPLHRDSPEIGIARIPRKPVLDKG
jgi:hypothetical protein